MVDQGELSDLFNKVEKKDLRRIDKTADHLVSNSIKDRMFPWEKKCWELMTQQDTYLQGKLMIYQIQSYKDQTLIHGTGKGFLGTPQYELFMDNKWGFVYHDLIVMINLTKIGSID